ncbi:MAG: hypothetical protein ACJ0F8_02755 [Gammaproteobacteria bacterium]|uniref:Uncharacterized protein n=1 Tax=SAR86 cluster bacterium TaxID=2030880 RepID=A0A520N0A6_9GAMM|nr:hypothetical protein [Gammaproteobacteria bacterium]MBA4729613.1 hypothetical protein [SAR86 cluster bacterium]RZO26910.1 MAG: hypothetical protein EVA92_01820 [SAR86 cluster bacterium]|tara:strand:+ start:5121 stop:5390 length:270 start_codon:yes stop_codon:yes gene_type:complete
MNLIKILSYSILSLLLSTCASTDASKFEEERKAKLTELKSECDFVTTEFIQGQEIFICHKSNATRIKKKDILIEEEIQEKEIPENPENV